MSKSSARVDRSERKLSFEGNHRPSLQGNSGIIAACWLSYFSELHSMSPIINPESAGKERTQFTKAIVLAVRELAKQTDVTDEVKDLAAFIALALKSISEGIDVSVVAWEKRGY